MFRKKLTDYYPVYKDVSDILKNMSSEQRLEYQYCETYHSPEQQVPEPGSFGSPAVLNAEELASLASKCGFSTFQIVILLIKNAFEGHVFLTHNIRPDQLFRQGTFLIQAKPEFMIVSFYEHFKQYEAGFNQIWKIIQEREADLTGIRFELLIHNLIINHFIRFPVSLFSTFDIRLFTELMLMNQQAMDQRFELVILGERALGELEFIDKINSIYDEKFKDFLYKLRIKEDVFSHYRRKLALSLYPNIYTEEELEELMYKKLIEDKLNGAPHDVRNVSPFDRVNSETSSCYMRIRDKIKILYRYVSKNCFEVHSASDSENSFPELNHVFLEANSIYNEPVSNLPEALLQFMRLILLLSKVVIFRKTQGFALADSPQLVSDLGGSEVVSKDDLKLLRKDLDARIVAFRLKSLTDYKVKFVMDDDLTDIHNHFLQKQMDFIDQQIIQIQSDIKEILKMKSQVSIFNTTKN